MPGKLFLSIGECMVELSAAPGGLLRKGFAGDTFNTAWHARRILGEDWTVAYFTATGDDALSGEMLDFFQASGIDTRYIRRLPGRTPGLYLITLKGAERSFTYWRDSSAARSLADDEEALGTAIAAADVLYVSGISLAILPAAHRARLVSALADAKNRGAIVAFDPNIRLRLWPDAAVMRTTIEAAAGAATICLPSFDDETAAFGDVSPEAAAERYRRWSGGMVVMKNGAAGTLILDDGSSRVIQPELVSDAVDTTGAGDSFNAGFLAGLLEGCHPDDAVRRGNRLAGQVIRHHGALVAV
ncbi:sugar kinase [Mangrovicella endophytica]|uniref:sugar kinase n=1 Tax=Mangrovicella endophytica TaxID=2066697 RepID=UPI000C9EB804|nr:sugar kinase [Mangrovicella endophytica]